MNFKNLLPPFKWFKQKTTIENPYAFDDLAPIDEINNHQVYMNALEWSLSNKKIHNIAITGPYGSGKSSILKTFERLHTKHKYLKISLASFKEDELQKPNKDKKQVPGENGYTPSEIKKNETQLLVELSILQQMFYKVQTREIPDSRFKRIRNLNNWALSAYICIILLSIAAISFLLFPKFLSKFPDIDYLYKNYPQLAILVPLIALLPAFTFICINTIRFFNHSGFSKLNITSGEIEINPKSETSILNKYLDEIIYFFQVKKFDVVIFEDLDRFNDPDIFIKLREINLLLNNYRHIVFVYAIKDDMFMDERTRTKFFDFIIPVIPVINWSNSKQIMLDKINDNALNLNIDPRFISAITLYIDDMRTLKNVFNEFILYKSTLKISDHLHTKLFALIVYKNIYPDDFALLYNREGIIAKVFKQKNQLIKKIVGNIELEIQNIREQIRKGTQLHLKNLEELRGVYLLKIADSQDGFSQFYIDDKKHTFTEISQDESQFQKIIDGKDVNYTKYGVIGAKKCAYDFAEIEKQVHPEPYAERASAIQTMGKTTEKEQTKRLEQLKLESEQIVNFKFQEILNYNEEIIESLDKNFIDKNLLVYLVREGYIDESYPNLITHFYPGTISRADMEFLSHVNDRNNLSFNYPLEQIEGLLEEIEVYEFEREVLLNFKILDFLLLNADQYSIQLNKIILQIEKNSERSFQFFQEYIHRNTNVEAFIFHVSRHCTNIWEVISKRYNETEKDEFLKLLILHSDLEKIEGLNINGSLSIYIEEHPDFVSLIKEPRYFDNTKLIINALESKLENLKWHEDGIELFDYIYHNGHYKLNYDTIKCILENKGDLTAFSINNLQTAHYTTIKKSKCIHLQNYIEEEIQEYILLFIQLRNNHKEAEDSILALINHHNIPRSIKDLIIQKTGFTIKELTSTEQANWDELLSQSKVIPSWNNVITYYRQTEVISKRLIDYLENTDNLAQLVKKKFPLKGKKIEPIVEDFEHDLLNIYEISDETYNQLLKSTRFTEYPGLQLANHSEQKVKGLLFHRKIALTKHNFEILKSSFDGQLTMLIIQHFKAYLKDIDKYELSGQHINTILRSKLLNDEQKISYINMIPDQVKEHYMAATAATGIFANHPEIKLETEDLISYISASLSYSANIQLLLNHIAELDTEEIRMILSKSNGKYVKLTGKGSTTFDYNELNQRLAIALKDKEIISSYSVNDNKTKIKINGRKKT